MAATFKSKNPAYIRFLNLIDVLDRINKETSAKTSRFVPILLTSSETREGGAELWSVLLDALAGEASPGFRPEKQIDED
jgi:hypothetical protein